MLEDRFKDLSKHIIGITSITKAVNKWNTIHIYQYHEAQMESDINKCRNDLSLIMNCYFMQIQLLPGRLWTNPEDLMFYIYIDQCIREKYNVEESLCKFSFYSGRTISNVVHKAATYLPLLPFFRKTSQYDVIALLQQISNRYSRDTAAIFINKRYTKAQQHIDNCLTNQQAVIVPLVNSKNQPDVHPIDQGGHSAEDLVAKFNVKQTTISGDPPFSSGDTKATVTDDSAKPKPQYYGIPKARIVGNIDVSDYVPFTEDAPKSKSKPKVEPKVEPVPINKVEVLPTIKDGESPDSDRPIFHCRVERLILNQERDAFKPLNFTHPMARILNQHMPELMDQTTIFNQILHHEDSIATFKTRSTDFKIVHQFILICLRGRIGIRAIATFLRTSSKALSKYILDQRSNSPDFIRRPGKSQFISYLEMNVIWRYIKEINSVHHVSVFDSIYVAAQIFNLPAKWLIHNLVVDGIITSETYHAKTLNVQLTSLMHGRTKTLTATTQYVRPPIGKLTIELVRGQRVVMTDTNFVDQSKQQVRDPNWMGSKYCNIIPSDWMGYLIETLFPDKVKSNVDNTKPTLRKKDVTIDIIDASSQLPANKVPNPDNVPSPTLVQDSNKIVDIEESSTRWKKNVVTEFVRWRCIRNDGAKISFEHMYIAFEMYCKDKHIIPMSVVEFNKTMIMVDVKKISDEFGGYYWNDLRFFEENLVRSELDMQFEQLCTTVKTIFPNITTKHAIQMVSIMIATTPDTTIETVDMGLVGKVLAFNNLSASKLKELEALFSTR